MSKKQGGTAFARRRKTTFAAGQIVPTGNFQGLNGSAGEGKAELCPFRQVGKKGQLSRDQSHWTGALRKADEARAGVPLGSRCSAQRAHSAPADSKDRVAAPLVRQRARTLTHRADTRLRRGQPRRGNNPGNLQFRHLAISELPRFFRAS